MIKKYVAYVWVHTQMHGVSGSAGLSFIVVEKPCRRGPDTALPASFFIKCSPKIAASHLSTPQPA